MFINRSKSGKDSTPAGVVATVPCICYKHLMPLASDGIHLNP